MNTPITISNDQPIITTDIFGNQSETTLYEIFENQTETYIKLQDARAELHKLQRTIQELAGSNGAAITDDEGILPSVTDALDLIAAKLSL